LPRLRWLRQHQRLQLNFRKARSPILKGSGTSSVFWQARHVTNVAFDSVASADLVIDRVYEGGKAGNAGDDPINRILRVGNSGGFRWRGSLQKVDVLVLYTTGSEPDWPDRLDLADGTFIYYGDNRHPGRELHDTSKKGNQLLRQMFEQSQSVHGRELVPPIFLFEKAGRGRDVVFRGLLVPGAPSVPVDEQLVAVWRSAKGSRFQNYRATFSVLDDSSISRKWIERVIAGNADDPDAPSEWRAWKRTGVPRRLRARRSLDYRSREDQLPNVDSDFKLLSLVHQHFAPDPYEFEGFAVDIWRALAPSTDDDLEVTRRSRDGGRDAVGHYRIGPASDPIRIEFALEAKCYQPQNAVGVKETSRLISRLRNRQFGVLITTSFVNKQAYQEIRDDAHPVVIVSGRDIVEVLKQRGLADHSRLTAWLESDFPVVASDQRLDIVHSTTAVDLEVEVPGAHAPTEV
jgi:hypothetical protein